MAVEFSQFVVPRVSRRIRVCGIVVCSITLYNVQF
jgi:hypothetical protein